MAGDGVSPAGIVIILEEVDCSVIETLEGDLMGKVRRMLAYDFS
jgi:hypothetical protein